MARGMGALILKDVFGVLQPLLIRAAIDSLNRGSALVVVIQFAGWMLGVALLKGLFQYCR